MKTIRLFISSTFDDFKLERDVIQKEVLPKLSSLCAENGFSFMPIDLRWGVSEEAQLDQRTIELCLSEVNASKSKPHPDFLILSGNRYGWIPIPYLIEQNEFEEIYEKIESINREIIDKWYKLDNNQIPPSYILQKREGEFIEYESWKEVEDRLRSTLQKAVTQTNLDKKSYFTSATELEFIEYIKDTQNRDSIFLIDRDIEKRGFESTKFFDNHIKEFKENLKSEIPQSNQIAINTFLENEESISNIHLKELVDRLLEKLSDSIKREIKRVKSIEKESEVNSQKFHKESINQSIIGRDNEVREILNYIESEKRQPLFIHGKSGIGKSSIMAKAINETKSRVIYRFCGISQESSSTKALLKSILKELGIELEEKSKSEELLQNQEDDKFELEVKNAILGINESVTIYIDALDQLGDKSKCEWLPSILPQNIKIVISLLNDESYRDDNYYYEKLSELFDNFYEIKGLSDSEVAKEILLNSLKEYNRTLQESQIEYILNIYKDINSPLYLKIITQIVRYWDSNEQNLKLVKNQKEAIDEYLESLTLLFHHNKKLVDRFFSYIYASQNSINEATLYEILSNDKELVKEVENEHHDNITNRLPTAIYSRLIYQIAPFIKEDESENIHFFHREFRDGAKKLYSYELSQKLLSILENMIDNKEYKSEQEKFSDTHLLTLTNQKLNYPDGEIEEQVRYLVCKEKEYWLNKYLEKLNKKGIDFFNHNENFWAIACGKIILEVFKKLYERFPSKYSEQYLSSKINLKNFYREGGLFDEEEIIDNENSKLKAKFSNTEVCCLLDKAVSLNRKGKTLDAIKLAKEAFDIVKMYEKNNTKNGKWIENYIAVINVLIDFYAESNQLDKAISLGEENLNKVKKLCLNETELLNERYLVFFNNLASAYSKDNNLDKAIELAKESFNKVKKFYKDENNRWVKDYITYSINLTNYLNNKNTKSSIEEAIGFGENGLTIIKKIYKTNPKYWIEYYTISLNNLATSYYKQNKKEEALKLSEEAYLESKKILGENHFNTQQMKKNYLHIKNEIENKTKGDS